MNPTRRQILKAGLGLATSLVLPLEALAENQRLSFLNLYDNEIKNTLNYFDQIHGRVPERNLIKAMVCVESGSQAHRQTAFMYDPMQIANEGDYALSVLASEKEHTTMIGDFSALKGIRHTPRINGQWDYSNSNMTPTLSFLGGIGWLFHKSAKRNYVDGELQITSWRDWENSLERYNGGGDKNYVEKVLEIKDELDKNA